MPRFRVRQDDDGLWVKDGERYRFDRVLGNLLGDTSKFLVGDTLAAVAESNGYVRYEEPPVELTEDMRQAKRQELANARYAAEIGGIEVNGMAVRTDRETQSILGNARQYAKDDPSMTVEWKLGNGQFVTLDSPTIISLAGAVLQHVQAQFTKEKELNAQVDAAETVTDLQAINW